MKYYIIAGEASGDLHGSNLMKAIKELDTQATFRCWGGDLIQGQMDTPLVKHYKDIAFMGFVEVVKNLPTIFKGLRFCKKDILEYEPDVLLLIDYPGFNLRIAEFAKAKGIKVFYYIAPQVWAWRSSRVKKIKRIVDHLFVILPFEKAFFKKWEMDVDYVGHPLLDAIEKDNLLLEKQSSNDEKPIIALLPGSRQQEVKRILPIMLEAVEQLPDYQFVIAGTSALSIDFYQSLIQDQNVGVRINETYDLLRQAKAALVTSGTATLETALFKVPQVVCYKGNWISYHIGRRLINVKYISLVNLILEEAVVEELIQDDCTAENMANGLKKLFQNPSFLQNKYQILAEQLGQGGASNRTAQLVMKYLSKDKS